MLQHAFKVLISVKAKLFFSFLAMTVLLAALGGYSLYSITQTGNTVKDTFDRPLMAINFARAAGQNFAQMELAALRGSEVESLPELLEVFEGDVAVAKERSISERATPFFEELDGLTKDWARIALSGAASTEQSQAQRREIAEQVIDNLDIIVELQTNESFRNRETALAGVEKVKRYSLIASAAALILSFLLSAWLAVTIINPLKAAAAAARKISAGNLQTKIPEGGEDETGVLLKTLSVMQKNIAWRMEKEQSSRALAQTRLAESLENSKDAILLTDIEAKIIVANQQVETLFPDLAEKDIIGSDLAKHFDMNGAPLSIGNEFFPEDNEIFLADGRWARVNASRTEEGGLLMIWTDITHAKEINRNLMEAKEQAEAADKAKTLFLAAMSHELRTPLNAVIGFSDVIKMHLETQNGAEKHVELAELISQNGSQLLNIVKDVLDVASTNDMDNMNVQRERINVIDVIDYSVATMREEISEKKLQLIWQGFDDVFVSGDNLRLGQALLNLIGNAVKFNRPGGAVKIDVALSNDNQVHIHVIDNGIGISSEHIDQVTKPFVQADDSYTRQHGGTGLGLAVVKKIMSRHHGELTLRSQAGRGTCATLTLPLYQAGTSGLEADETEHLKNINAA